MSQRGTDPATERRRLRDSDEEDATGRLLEAIFWVSTEAFCFGLPVLAWTMLYGDVAVTFVVVAALAAVCLVGGVVRFRGGDGDDRDDQGWPPLTVRLVIFRLAYYNVALAGAVAVGQTLVTESVVRVHWTPDPLVGPAAVAALLAGLAAWLLPRSASVVES